MVKLWSSFCYHTTDAYGRLTLLNRTAHTSVTAVARLDVRHEKHGLRGLCVLELLCRDAYERTEPLSRAIYIAVLNNALRYIEHGETKGDEKGERETEKIERKRERQRESHREICRDRGRERERDRESKTERQTERREERRQ